jgi:hypothetical protein
MILRFVLVTTGEEVARALLADDGTVAYEGSNVAASTVNRFRFPPNGKTEADVVRELATEGWSNGYIKTLQDQDSS